MLKAHLQIRPFEAGITELEGRKKSMGTGASVFTIYRYGN